MAVDHFKVLGLQETASSEEIKQAYFKLAKIHHPDASKIGADSVDRFRLICTSYEVLKNENLRADYLLNKNGHSWERKGTNHYNDVNSDFRSSAQKAASRQSAKDIQQFMNAYERWVHPSRLLIVVPTSLLIYYLTTSYVPSFFKKNTMEDGSVAGAIKANKDKRAETVDAWKNPKTDRWESPAPWDPQYKSYIANTPLEKIDRNKVTQARPGGN